MKNFKIILIVTLILDIIQFIPLALAKMGGEMKNQMISDFNIEGLANSAPALEVLDIMLYIFGFIWELYSQLSSLLIKKHLKD